MNEFDGSKLSREIFPTSRPHPTRHDRVSFCLEGSQKKGSLTLLTVFLTVSEKQHPLYAAWLLDSFGQCG